MSLAVFTDSTTAHASPAFTWRPTAGSSTKTTSVSSCCAWSVMPTVAVSPLTRTHSCDLAYFRSEGTLLINLLKTHRRLRRWRRFSSQQINRSTFPVNRLLHHDGRVPLAPDLNLNLCVRRGSFRRHIAHADAQIERRAL